MKMPGFSKHPVPILLATGLTAFGLAAYSAYELELIGAKGFHGTEYADRPPAPPFALVNQRGEPTRLDSFRGRPVLLYFGYTRCPDVCPLTLGRLTTILRDAGIGDDRLALLMVSVDPEHDTPDRLDGFVDRYDGRVTALTGDPAEIPELLAAYGVYAVAATDHEGHPTLAHTNLVFGIDAAGRLRVLIHADDLPERVLEDIRRLMR